MMAKNRSMSPGSVIPEIPYLDVNEASGWLSRVFGFSPRLRIGNHRVQLTFGDGSIVATSDAGQPHNHCSVLVHVEGVDAHHEHAKKQGARILNPPTDYPYGERQYTAEDLAGHRWTFSQTIKDVDPTDWGGQLFGNQ